MDAAAPLPPSQDASAPRAVQPRRGAPRLFRKYFVLILALVTGALLIPSSISLYFSYHETLDALHGIQREKALAAAGRIEQYIENVQSQLRGAALAQLGTDGTEQRRIEFLKLLKQVPLITDIAYLGGDGCEKARVSRLSMDASGDCLRDRSGDPAFLEPTPSRPWYGPVTFRKETEPYMQIAVRSGGDKGPVTIADVNLKFMWDAITRIRIGEKGKAYVVDAAGYLIADPDIGLVLRKTDLSGLAHVKAALDGGADDVVVVTRDAAGVEVLSAHARIDPLGWTVFVEQPASEVLARLNASILRIGLLLLAGLVISALVAMWLARRMALPISTLQEGAQLIGEGRLDHAIDVRTGDELEALADQFNRMTGQLRESYAGLERKVEERTAALTTSLEQQTAISEILRVISASPTDVQPVLQEVAQRAARLCEAEYARILLSDGDTMRTIADYSADGSPPGPGVDIPLERTSISGRAAIERRTIHHADVVPLLATEYPGAVENAARLGFRAVLAVPLIRDAGAYGSIFLYRRVPRAFSLDQIALVETFARQSAIAIDNVRLFNQTKEALDQQTAISEILRVISASPTDVQPVMDAVAKRAALLCDAPSAHVMLREGDKLHVMSSFSRGEISAIPAGYEVALDRTMITGRAVLDGATVHHADIVPLLDDEFRAARENSLKFGFRAVLAVPLMRESTAYGTLFVWRPVPGYFAPDQVALLETFARQAAIAIDNVRLFNQTKEALDQQRASAEVLSAISSSISDVKPVFDVILASCQRLFDGHNVGVIIVRPDGMLDIGAYKGEGYEELSNAVFPMPLDRRSGGGTAILERHVIEIPDADAADVPERTRQGTHAIGVGSIVFAPMLSEGRALGALWVGRRSKGRFGEKPMALLKTFAEQAVIAINNTRLFNETRDALEQQRASGEVLAAISNSIADVGPVFDVILGNCQRLIGARNVGMTLLHDDGMLHIDAQVGPGFEELKGLFPRPIGRDVAGGISILERKVLVYPDLDAPDVPAVLQAGRRSLGDKSFLCAPMLLGDRAIGALWIGREHKGAFADKDIALLKTFAGQAVIALQNSRLFNETREALEQQKASGEVLAAISSSIADTAPVFDKILESCQRLFAGEIVGVMLRHDDETIDLGAYAGTGRERLRALFPRPLTADSVSGEAILGKRTVDCPDIDAPGTPPMTREFAKIVGYRSIVAAPMIFEGRSIGALWLGRSTTGPFPAKQLVLLRTFADQAVIAIQNARLFNETREALEQQKASSEVLAAISSSIADTTPVFERIVSSCEHLFAGRIVGINLVGDDGQFHLGAYRGSGREELLAGFPLPLDEASGSGMAILRRSVVHFPDVASADVPPATHHLCDVTGQRAVVFAPMLWEGRGLGVIFVGRPTAGPFSPKEIALLKTFADQAAIAIQNARLFREIEQKSRELEVASQHKSEFLANMSHELRTPLNAIIGFSEVLIERMFGELNVKQDDYLKDIHSSGVHLLSLINDILDLSKVEAGRMELETSRFDAPIAIHNAMTLVRERAQRHGIALAADLAPDVTEITADERKFKQILLNLLTNAVKFTPDGGRVDVIARRAGGALEVAVRDTGIGIAKADHAAVFEEFRQVGRHYTNKQEGTGLGLALTRRFVELHGGTIRLESEPGKGSTFTFTIPEPARATEPDAEEAIP